ncbi:hypothetical protein [Arthrobacter sp. MMS18-M83]|uniref:hypothetical protein n=1 Tax=Arthrobacter sp. MMS18-M83 TaxID=2996261 RepID=UPI00227C191E|nr:hypothetical protein [Arthrobacter sp. MMS18-M83]WAH97414.1 hypothetical protein OW521_00445 [Arthrobacter sp. MMS18-M83]
MAPPNLETSLHLKHHSLVLFASDAPIVDSYSFRVARPEDVELFSQQLSAQDIEVIELPHGHQSGRGTAIRFLVPQSEHPFELYYDIDTPQAPEEIRSKLPSNSSRRRGLGVRRIDHFNVQAAPQHVGAAEQWLRDQLTSSDANSCTFPRSVHWSPPALRHAAGARPRYRDEH